jgi:hypothetical protein
MRVTRTPAADWPEKRKMSLPDTEKPSSWARLTAEAQPTAAAEMVTPISISPPDPFGAPP